MSVRKSVPDAQEILRAWLPFKKLVGVTSVRSKKDYERANATIAALLAEVGDDETHPLADVLDYLSDQVRAWEAAHVTLPAATPADVLRFLMEQHGLLQEDLADCAPQSRISDYLNERRDISRAVAKRLAARFGVRADLFL